MSEREEVCGHCGCTGGAIVQKGDLPKKYHATYEYCLSALRAQLTTAERERDEARRERDVLREEVTQELERGDYWRDAYDNATESLKAAEHRAERAERVVGAARDILRGGSHGSPCTNEDEWDDGPCTLHLAASQQRRERLEAEIRALDAAEG